MLFHDQDEEDVDFDAEDEDVRVAGQSRSKQKEAETVVRVIYTNRVFIRTWYSQVQRCKVCIDLYRVCYRYMMFVGASVDPCGKSTTSGTSTA